MKQWLIIIPIVLVLINLYLFVKIRQNREDQASEYKVQVQNSETDSSPARLRFTVPESKPKITLAAVGDINLGREVNWQIINRKDPLFPFQKTADLLKGADLTIGNLEGPLIKSCPTKRTGMQFCGQAINVEGLAFSGFDLMNLANNHIENYGPDGIKQTIEILNENQIDYFGQEKVAEKEINGIRISLLGFDDIVRHEREGEIAKLVEEEKSKSRLVIVSFHWGNEYQKIPTSRQRDLAHLVVDHGADLVIGHHPHVLQPIEYYQEKPILFSLGNFVFDQMWSQETRTGAIALITIEEDGPIKVEIKPVIIQDYGQPELILEPEASKIIQSLSQK